MGAVTPPRWFYAILAGCALVISGAVVYRLVRPAPPRWQFHTGAMFDPVAGISCGGVLDREWGCIDMRTGRTVGQPAPRGKVQDDPFASVPITRAPH